MLRRGVGVLEWQAMEMKLCHAARLDYSKPPPGWVAAEAIGVLFYSPHDLAAGSLTLDAAWAHYKAASDPPGMWTEWEADDKHFAPTGPGEWSFGMITRTHHLGLGHGPGSHADGVAGGRWCAWLWYDHRHVLADRIGRETVLVSETLFRGHRVGLPSTSSPVDVWPRCLTWSDEQVAEVERWLRDSTAEMPGVLRG